MKVSLVLVSILFWVLALAAPVALANFSIGPWELLGAEDNLLNGISTSDSLLFATTDEGFHYYNQNTGSWTDRTNPGWIGAGRFCVIRGQSHDQRLVTGGVNAWFKGTLFISTNMGGDDHLTRECEGGEVTDLQSSPLPNDPALYACTWSDIVPGEFLRSDDDGNSWTALTGHNHHAMTDLAVFSSDMVFLAGDNFVTLTKDGGQTWTSLQANLPVQSGIYCIMALPPVVALPVAQKEDPEVDILLASNDTGLYQYNFEAELWETVLPFSCRSMTQRFMQTDTFEYWTETYVVTWDGRVLFIKDHQWDQMQDVTGDLSADPIDVEANSYGVFVALQGGGVYQSEGWLPASDVPQAADGYNLSAFPNPFNPATTITFEMPVSGHAFLQVFDLRGARVATLLDGTKSPGPQSVGWRPEGLGSGVYRAVLQVNGKTVSHSLVLLK